MGCASSKTDVVECEEEHSTSLGELNVDQQSPSVKEEPIGPIEKKTEVANATPDISDKGFVPPRNDTPICHSDTLISPVHIPAENESLPRVVSLSQQEEIVSHKISIKQESPSVEHKTKFSSESAFADVTDQYSEHLANHPESLPIASNSISPLDSPKKGSVANEFDTLFRSLSKQDKINALSNLLTEFSTLSKQVETSTDLLPLLKKLYSVVVLENDAYGSSYLLVITL